MNAKLYRCGWCGMPTDSNGNTLSDLKTNKVICLVEKYGDSRTHKTNGECCGGQEYANEQAAQIQNR